MTPMTEDESVEELFYIKQERRSMDMLGWTMITGLVVGALLGVVLSIWGVI